MLSLYGSLTYKIAYHLLMNGEGYFDTEMAPEKKETISIVTSALTSMITISIIRIII